VGFLDGVGVGLLMRVDRGDGHISNYFIYIIILLITIIYHESLDLPTLFKNSLNISYPD